jgi:CarD family transcriptional regulator
MYQAGELIFYCSEGVCRVEGVETLDISGIDSEKLYYNLSPVYHVGNIYVPVDTKLFMRPIIRREEAQRLITLIPLVKVEVASNQSRRMLEESYNRYLQTHDCLDLIRLLKSIHLKASEAAKEKKKLGAIDERFKKKAEDLLFGEFAIALNIPKEGVKDYIENRVREIGVKDIAI